MMRDVIASGLAALVVAAVLTIGVVWQWFTHRLERQAAARRDRQSERAQRRWPPT